MYVSPNDTVNLANRKSIHRVFASLPGIPSTNELNFWHDMSVQKTKYPSSSRFNVIAIPILMPIQAHNTTRCHTEVMDRSLHCYTSLSNRASNLYFDYIGYCPFRFVNVSSVLLFFFQLDYIRDFRKRDQPLTRYFGVSRRRLIYNANVENVINFFKFAKARNSTGSFGTIIRDDPAIRVRSFVPFSLIPT